jgi:hypothetical protein
MEGMSSTETAGNSLAYCRKDMNLQHPVGECPYDRDPAIAVYDMVLPSPPGPCEAAGWSAWRSAGGNLVTEAGRKVPWPSRPAKCYRMASGSVVHVKPDCRC